MKISAEVSRLVSLAKALPGQIDAAAAAVTIAQRQLAHILVARAAGLATRPSVVAVARMTLARMLRNAEDLQRIKGALPALLEKADVSPQAVRLAAVA